MWTKNTAGTAATGDFDLDGLEGTVNFPPIAVLYLWKQITDVRDEWKFHWMP